LVIALLLVEVTEIHAAKKIFQAGAAAVDITPLKLPVSMTGSFQDRFAQSAHDPLHARSLVLDDGNSQIAFVIVDSCLLTRDIQDAAKEQAHQLTGIPVNRMLIAATHTHTAPTSVPLAQCHPDLDYVKYMTGRIAVSIQQAQKKLKPAQAGWAVVSEPNEVGNRRWKMKPGSIPANPFGQTTDRVRMNPPRASADLIEPAGPIDPDISFLYIKGIDEKPIAVMANYSLHYVGGLPPNQLSADYFGEFARRIHQKLGGEKEAPDFVGMLSNGTSGDINNYNFRKPRPRAKPFERIEAVAEIVAEHAHSAIQKMKFKTRVPLKMAEKEIELKVRKPDEVELVRAKRILAEAKDPKRLNSVELYAQETVRMVDFPDAVKIKLQAIKVGPVGITANPCESFAEIGLELKAKSPFKTTFNIGLANGYNGYLPTPRQHALAGYETWRSAWSYLEVDASTHVTTTLLELLQELKSANKSK